MDHDCPSLTELQELLSDAGDLTDLNDCPRCLALVKLLRGREDSPLIALDFAESILEAPGYQPEVPERNDGNDLGPGSLVSVIDAGAGTGPFLLGAITVVRDESFEIAPITDEREMATEWDLLLEADQSSLGYAAAIEIWNHGTVGRDQVDEVLGELDEPNLKGLLDLLEAVFVEASPPAGVTVGPPVLGDADPRLLFQAAEVERVQRFWRLDEPAARPEVEAISADEPGAPLRVAALAASSVGAVAKEWMDREGWDRNDLARKSGYLEYQLEPILEDRIDPCAELYSHERVGRFLNAIDFDEDEEALLASVDASVFPLVKEKSEERYAFNRDGLTGRRRRSSKAEEPRRELTAAQIEQARSYARDVLAALEDLRES